MPPAATAPRHILVVDAEGSTRHALVMLLQREGYHPTSVASLDQALAELDQRGYDALVVDSSALAIVDELRARGLGATVIAMTASASVEAALEAMKRGAHDCLARPFRPDDVLLALRKAEERERLLREGAPARPVGDDGDDDGLRKLVARTARMQEIFKTLRKIAEYKTTVLITGESGTGKELIARAVHAQSPRARGPFVAVNCGAIPDALLESELFGHRKGAFTDAHRDHKGMFEEASGGTLFLDELGELPLALQVKLLRVLQESEIRPVGSTSDLKIDVRVVAATVRDLAAEVAAGRFREDLFYRLNVLQLALPPLRERREDIPSLVEHFVAKTNARLGTRVAGASSEAMGLLLEHAWPGNVRELENTIERAMVLADGDRIEVEALPERIRDARDPIRMTLLSGELSIKKTTRVIEEQLIRKALRATSGNRTNAAKLLEISHRALLYKIKEFGIPAREGSGAEERGKN